MRPLYLIVSAAVAVSAFVGIGAASADDVPAGTYAATPRPAYNWSGCYLGGYLGVATHSREVNAWDPVSTGGVFPAGTFYDPVGPFLPLHKVDIGEFNYNLDPGVIGGGTLGCNWQGVIPFVFGVEGEGGYMKISGATVSPYDTRETTASTRIGDVYGSVSGRFGYAWDRVLLYLKGGVGFANINASVIDSCSAAPCSPGLLTATGSSRQPFWAGGAGVEYAFNNSWSVKAEFLNLGMYKRFEVCGPGAAAAAGSTFCGIHAIEGLRTYKLGVNYHFNTANIARD